ncbi:MAG TPA: hypothetical protein VMB21_02295 [Candidatus Limnocylindria bacterium]|nr:hypothetical protein [Candidatus Limnocylindria bacterium]
MLALMAPVLAAPKITDFAPKKGPPGTQVQIVGSGFIGTGTPKVNFFTGGSGGDAIVTSFNANNIFVVVPSDAQTGPIYVTVSGFSSPNSSSYFQPSPIIRDFYTDVDGNMNPVTPVKGAAGKILIIRGLNLNDYPPPAKSAVFVGGVKIADPFPADNQIRLTLPDGLQTGQIVVTNSAGTATNNASFSGGLIYFNPLVTRFTASAAAGATIDIFGKSFLGVTDVRFGGNVPAQFTVVSGTNIQAVVPATATDGPLTVTSPGGSYITTTNFLIGPSVLSFSPVGGPSGTVVTITGTGLSNTKKVLFGSVAATAGTNINANTVTAVVPINTFTAPITVITANGTNTSATPFYLPPQVNGLSPSTGPVGTVVTLTGVNFTGTTKVELAGQSLAGFTVTATNKITVTVPDGAVSGKFRVTTPGGVDDSADTFTVVGPSPTIVDFTPTGGPVGTVVTISGANLTTVTNVQFNGVNASFTVNGANVVATVPASATTGPIRVANPAGQVTSGGSFTVAGNADLQVTLTPSLNPAIAYGVLGYGLQLVNRGPLAAAGVKLEFTIPTGASFDSVDGQANFEVVGSKVTFTPNNLALREAYNATVKVRLGAAGSLTAKLVASSTTPDDVPANNTATSTITSVLPALLLSPLDGSTVFLQWPSPATNFVLERAVLLKTTSVWSAVTNAPDDDGVTRQLILPATNSAAYFRLRLNQ